jgi:hypothetical protein
MSGRNNKHFVNGVLIKQPSHFFTRWVFKLNVYFDCVVTLQVREVSRFIETSAVVSIATSSFEQQNIWQSHVPRHMT